MVGSLGASGIRVRYSGVRGLTLHWGKRDGRAVCERTFNRANSMGDVMDLLLYPGVLFNIHPCPSDGNEWETKRLILIGSSWNEVDGSMATVSST